jgi:hypothetical protein
MILLTNHAFADDGRPPAPALQRLEFFANLIGARAFLLTRSDFAITSGGVTPDEVLRCRLLDDLTRRQLSSGDGRRIPRRNKLYYSHPLSQLSRLDRCQTPRKPRKNSFYVSRIQMGAGRHSTVTIGMVRGRHRWPSSLSATMSQAFRPG